MVMPARPRMRKGSPRTCPGAIASKIAHSTPDSPFPMTVITDRKAFDKSAPLGALTQATPRADARIWLSVNGVTKQDAKLSDMIWSAPEIIAHLSRSWALEPGDLIFTGTPAGVGPIVADDAVACGVEGLPELAFRIAPR